MARKLNTLWSLCAACSLAILPATPAAAQPQPPGPLGAEAVPLTSPRATMKTFLSRVNAGDAAAAAQCLDWSGSSSSAEARAEKARQLKDIIDRMAWVDLARISDQPEGPPFRFPPGAAQPPIEIARNQDGSWQFTAQTVAQIDQLYAAWKDRPLVVASTPWYRQMTPLGMEAWRVAALFLSILIAWIAGHLLRWILNSGARSLERRQRRYGGVTLRALSRIAVPALLVLGLKTGIQFLLLPLVVETIANTVISILFAVVVAYAIWRLVDVVDTWLNDFSQQTPSKLDDMLAPIICGSIRVTIVVLALVQIATILSDKPPSSIIAGLGVGGLAIGLAAQDSVKNFFGSIMIFSDRPFDLGDRVQVDSYDGAVEAVGFRSTRIRTLDGHLVTIPNGELANKAIRNVAKRPNIRRIMNLGLTYDTSPDKVRQAIEIVQELLADHEGQDPDLPPRVYFNDFTDSALNLSVIYWYHPADWWPYNDFSQRLNMEILQRFNAAGIEFAFPTQTIHLAGGGGGTPA